MMEVVMRPIRKLIDVVASSIVSIGVLSCSATGDPLGPGEQVASKPLAESLRDINFKRENTLPNTPPQQQGRTGFCWAYAFTGLVESLQLQRTSESVILSPEALGFYHLLDVLRTTLPNLQSKADLVKLGFRIITGSLELNSLSDEDGTLGQVSLAKVRGVVPESVYKVKFPPDKRVPFHPRAASVLELFPGGAKDLAALPIERAYRIEIVDNILHLVETKGLGYVRQMNEDSLVREVLVSPSGAHFASPPPTSFQYKGSTYTPTQFLRDYLRIDVDALQLRYVTKQPQRASYFAKLPNSIVTDLPTFRRDVTANLAAGIPVPFATAIDTRRVGDGSLTETGRPLLSSNGLETVSRCSRIVSDFEALYPSAKTWPDKIEFIPTLDDRMFDYLDCRVATNSLISQLSTSYVQDLGHGFIIVGPTNPTSSFWAGKNLWILKNSFGVGMSEGDPSVALANKLMPVTSDGMWTMEDGFLEDTVANAFIGYVTPRTPGVPPLLP